VGKDEIAPCDEGEFEEKVVVGIARFGPQPEVNRVMAGHPTKSADNIGNGRFGNADSASFTFADSGQ
jgi:hypothetical protein